MAGSLEHSSYREFGYYYRYALDSGGEYLVINFVPNGKVKASQPIAANWNHNELAELRVYNPNTRTVTIYQNARPDWVGGTSSQVESAAGGWDQTPAAISTQNYSRVSIDAALGAVGIKANGTNVVVEIWTPFNVELTETS